MRKKKKMNRIKNNGLFWFTFLLLVCISFPVSASTDAKQGEVDVQDIVFSHIKDAYTSRSGTGKRFPYRCPSC